MTEHDPLNTEHREALGIETKAAILDALRVDKTPLDIAEATDIPVATVYRQINEMEESGLISKSHRYDRAWKYQREIDKISIPLREKKPKLPPVLAEES